ncbi:MAG: hypothetical protein AB1767_01860 [Bacillota bacterium]
MDNPGTAAEGEPVWMITNHGSIGPGVSDNASGAAGAAVLARLLNDNPLPVPVRIMWTAGGDAQYTGGLAHYLDEQTLPGAALALCRLGTDQPAVFGFRRDTLFGRPRDLPPDAPDLAPEDYIKFIDPPPQHRSHLWDLDYPYIYKRLSSEGRAEIMVTPDHWMTAAETVDKDLKIGVLPASPTDLGLRLLETGAPTATYWRFSPYSNTHKDTLDRIIPEILGQDICFLDRVLREVTKEGQSND